MDPLLVARRPVGGQQQAGPTVTLDSLNTRPDSKSYSVELQQEEWPEEREFTQCPHSVSPSRANILHCRNYPAAGHINFQV